MLRLFELDGVVVGGQNQYEVGRELYQAMAALWNSREKSVSRKPGRLRGAMKLGEEGKKVGLVLEPAGGLDPNNKSAYLWVDGEKSGKAGESVRGKGTTRFKVGKVRGAPHGLGLRVDEDGSGTAIIWRRKLVNGKKGRGWLVPAVEVEEGTEIYWSVVAEVLANWEQVTGVLK